MRFARGTSLFLEQQAGKKRFAKGRKLRERRKCGLVSEGDGPV